MTKEAYFDMCRELGTEPNESEIPVEIEDFPNIVQQAFLIYESLQDSWEGMSGNYLGKNISNLQYIFDLYSVEQEDRLMVFKIISLLDSIRSDIIAKKIEAAHAKR